MQGGKKLEKFAKKSIFLSPLNGRIMARNESL